MPNGLGLIYIGVSGAVPPRHYEQFCTVRPRLAYGLIDGDLISLQEFHRSQSPGCSQSLMYRPRPTE